MPAETVVRRWTVATWLVAGAGDHLGAVVTALRAVDADAVTLQSIRERDAEAVAGELRQQVAWELSYYPKTPLFRRAGLGLCVITPHEISQSIGAPIRASSVWSSDRRVLQIATVRRADGTEYRLHHKVGSMDVDDDTGNAVVVTPEQVGVDSARAIALPGAATLVQSQVERPISTVAPLQTTTFEMPWVQGDFPV